MTRNNLATAPDGESFLAYRCAGGPVGWEMCNLCYEIFVYSEASDKIEELSNFSHWHPLPPDPS